MCAHQAQPGFGVAPAYAAGNQVAILRIDRDDHLVTHTDTIGARRVRCKALQPVADTNAIVGAAVSREFPFPSFHFGTQDATSRIP